MTLDQLALRVEPQQLISHVAHCALGLGFRFLPANSTQAIERRLMTFGARVTLHQIEPFDGNVQLGFLCIVKQHELAARSGS